MAFLPLYHFGYVLLCNKILCYQIFYYILNIIVRYMQYTTDRIGWSTVKRRIVPLLLNVKIYVRERVVKNVNVRKTSRTGAEV